MTITVVYIPLLVTLSLFRVVSLLTLIYNSSIIAIPSIVITVSYYIAKLIILEILIYLYSYIKGLSTEVLSLKDYSIPIYLLYNYYTIYI